MQSKPIHHTHAQDDAGSSIRLISHAFAALIGAALVIGALFTIPALADATDAPAPADTTDAPATADTTATAPGAKSDESHRHPRRGPGHRVKGAPEVLTTLLGLSADELRQEMRSGATLAEVAEANGISRSDVVSALTAAAEDRITTAQEAGKLTAEEADAKRAGIADRVEARLDRSITDRMDADRGHRKHRGPGKHHRDPANHPANDLGNA